MTVFEYTTSATGVIHLAVGKRTLCGRLTVGYTIGDETLSGHAATCGRCLQARADRQHADHAGRGDEPR